MLVTVIMLAYNDAPFVVRTLESIKAQTYKNIEIIISDDCSTDNTVEVCRKWLQNNREYFVNSKILTTPVNTGVTANCIRATAAASGEWLKGIGCDNLMAPDCIEKFVDFVKNHPTATLVQCRLQKIDENDIVIGEKMKGPDEIFHDDRTTAEQQYQLFLRKDPIDALGLFKKKSLLDSLGCYDSEFRNQEDTPFAFRVLKNGNKIWWINQPLVQRRMRVGSLSGLSDSSIVSKNNLVRNDIDRKYIIPNVGVLERLILKYKAFLNILFFSSLNKKTRINLFLWKFLSYPISMFYRYKIKSIKSYIKNKWN